MSEIKINRENIDEYYDLVNKKIDDYFEKGVSAYALSKYFSKDYGINKFLKREKLEDIKGIKKILNDVINDRMAIDENVKTFEQYNNNLNNLNIRFNINEDIEKVLSDIYRVSLGNIENKENDNFIKISGLKFSKNIIIFTKQHLNDIFYQLSNRLYNIITSKEIDLKSLEIVVQLNNKIDKEKFINTVYSEYTCSKRLDILPNIIYESTGNYYKLKLHDKEKNIIIFEENG